MQYPQEIEGVSNQDFLRTAMSQRAQEKIGLYDFIKSCEKGVQELEMNRELIHRSLNVGFSGGEKKKNEVLQIKLLKPSLIILDEVDSGLDVDSIRIVCENLETMEKAQKDYSVRKITESRLAFFALKLLEKMKLINNSIIINYEEYIKGAE